MSKVRPILVVEDEDLLILPLEDALIEAGFEAATVRSAEEAAVLLDSDPGKYVALVIDIDLRSKSNGWELARKARRLVPDFPVVYMTGSSIDDWASQGVPDSIFLQKPFPPMQLVTAVSDLLKRARTAA